jgi:hypothetical protein
MIQQPCPVSIGLFGLDATRLVVVAAVVREWLPLVLLFVLVLLLLTLVV